MAAQSSLQQFQESLAQRLREAKQSPAESRLGFEAGSRRYLVKLEDAGEVLPLPRITPVPLTRTWFLGLANVRGKLLSVVDLAAFLEGPATPQTAETRLVLLAERCGARAGLVVARVLGLKNRSALQACEGHDRVGASWLAGAYAESDNERIWHELDLSALAADERFLQAGL